MLEPLDAPDDRFGLNETWPSNWLMDAFLPCVPALGLGVMIGAFYWYLKDRDENPYNLAEVSRKTFLVGVMAQTIYLLFAIGWVVL